MTRGWTAFLRQLSKLPAQPKRWPWEAHEHEIVLDPDATVREVVSAPGTARVCTCNDVRKETIVDAVRSHDLKTVKQIGNHTSAATACHSCARVCKKLLDHELGRQPKEHQVVPVCSCTDMGHDEVRKKIQIERPCSLEDMMLRLRWRTADGCAQCRPALNYYMSMAFGQKYDDDPRSKVINERVHANIQRDGTYSVVPRMFGGVTTPSQLRALAEVAERFEVKAIKITGGQRIDLLGIRKELLPAIWGALNKAGFISGHAYAKSVRTVKTCVGTEWCRYGVQDSTSMGIDLEHIMWGTRTPHKVKLGVSGCRRNCAEATIKDVGIVAVDDGWDLYVGGASGTRVRAARFLCRVGRDHDVPEYSGAFIQLYREEGWYGERTAAFVERVGIRYVRERIVKDIAGRNLLFSRFMRNQKHDQVDPWASAAVDQVQEHFVPLSRLSKDLPS